jgi:hypothetical protein
LETCKKGVTTVTNFITIICFGGENGFFLVIAQGVTKKGITKVFWGIVRCFGGENEAVVILC